MLHEVFCRRKTAMTGRVLILAPSRGLGGGIERYVETLEWAFAAQGIACQRLDLAHAGLSAHIGMLAEARRMLRTSQEPTRLVVGHRTLMPTATVLARQPAVCGISVLCHGAEVWDARFRPRRRAEGCLMRRPGVRVVAVSSFTAGTLARSCQATILPPALSQDWFEMLVDAAAATRDPGPGVRLLTAFRLVSWREKGLPQLIEAIAILGRPEIHLTICGVGDPPPDLLRYVSGYSWCILRAGMSDRELARQLAAADLFVLATRTRSGRHSSGEGFGLVLLESQVAGTPVVVPAHGGSSDAYVEGVTGVAPDDETTEELAKLLDDLLKDRAQLQWMGERAAKWARESFAPERYAQLVARRLL